MIGASKLLFSNNVLSDKTLKKRLSSLAKKKNFDKYFARKTKSIEDDHLPFLKAGIASLHLIGFEDLSTWHQKTDRPDI